MLNLKALENANRVSVEYRIDDIDGEYVKQFRDRYNFTKIELANLMGVTKSIVCQWEEDGLGIDWAHSVLFTLFSHNDKLIEQIRKVKK